MNKVSRGLGRGLDALIPTAPDGNNEGHIQNIAMAEIEVNPFQPRRDFDEEQIEELAHSIQQYGLLQPIVVRKSARGYELAAGERRLRAARKIGMAFISALVKEYSDGEMTEIALIENLQRQNLNPIEEAAAYRRLLQEFGLTQEELSHKVGRSRSHIANFIRLLHLPPLVQDYVSRGTLSMGQARPLLALTSKELQMEAADLIAAEDLSAREVERLVKKLSQTAATEELAASKTEPREIFVVEAEDRLKMALGTQVKIKPGKTKSKIEIEFYSADDLDRIVEALAAPPPNAPVYGVKGLVV